MGGEWGCVGLAATVAAAAAAALIITRLTADMSQGLSEDISSHQWQPPNATNTFLLHATHTHTHMHTHAITASVLLKTQ